MKEKIVIKDKNIIGKITLMFYWYCKATYNLKQFFSKATYNLGQMKYVERKFYIENNTF